MTEKSLNKPTDPGNMPGKGRYLSDYPRQLVNWMSQGKSWTSFASQIGVDRTIMYKWLEKYPEFAQARALGKELELNWWEEQGQKGLWVVTEYNEDGKITGKKQLNTMAWIFSMKNRFKDLYGEAELMGILDKTATAIENKANQQLLEATKKLIELKMELKESLPVRDVTPLAKDGNESAGPTDGGNSTP